MRDTFTVPKSGLMAFKIVRCPFRSPVCEGPPTALQPVWAWPRWCEPRTRNPDPEVIFGPIYSYQHLVVIWLSGPQITQHTANQ